MLSVALLLESKCQLKCERSKSTTSTNRLFYKEKTNPNLRFSFGNVLFYVTVFLFKSNPGRARFSTPVSAGH